jgi:acetyltransferase-like isoleucine patch superfamily enzyme
MNFVARLFCDVLKWGGLVARYPLVCACRARFRSCGTNVHLDPFSYITFENVSVGSNVFLGRRATIVAAKSEIRIGSNVAFGPSVSIFGGGHNVELRGCPMLDVREKAAGDDLGVVIEDDVWVGTCAVILRGVTVGRGAVVGAGSVVTSSIPPYGIAAGNPARVIKYRGTVDEIIAHEMQGVSPGMRLHRSELEALRSASSRAC